MEGTGAANGIVGAGGKVGTFVTGAGIHVNLEEYEAAVTLISLTEAADSTGAADGTGAADENNNVVSSCENEDLVRELRNQISKQILEKKALRVKVKYYKRKAKKMQDLMGEQEKLLIRIKETFGITGETCDKQSKSAGTLPADFLKSYFKKASNTREKEYCGSIRKFALTLQLCSLKAYRYSYI